jgi:hypothetical protein
MANSIQCRLAYLVTPRPELLQTLNVEAKSGHDICRSTTVITPIRDYEEAFEGRKGAWVSKAKRDFITEFVDLWSGEFGAFAAQLRAAADPECFDKWWTISEVDIIEIDPAWRPP